MAEVVKLSSGHSLPRLGLGTWLSPQGEVGHAVEFALNNGYRHVDCAYIYQNQKEIGEAFARVFGANTVQRKDVFITSKIWNTFHSYERATQAIDEILKELRLDYLDLCLIHWPHGYQEGGELFPRTADGKKMIYSTVDYLETWRAMEDAVKAGKVRSVGLSNFNHKQIQRVIDNSTLKPAVLQVEFNPYFQQRKLREFCAERGIVMVGYCPLGGNPGVANPFHKPGIPIVLEESAIKAIAAKHSKSPAQVVLRWALQHGMVVIPKSTSEKRLRENLNVFDFELTADEVAQIDALDRGRRTIDLTARDGDHPLFPFNEPF